MMNFKVGRRVKLARKTDTADHVSVGSVGTIRRTRTYSNRVLVRFDPAVGYTGSWRWVSVEHLELLDLTKSEQKAIKAVREFDASHMAQQAERGQRQMWEMFHKIVETAQEAGARVEIFQDEIIVTYPKE